MAWETIEMETDAFDPVRKTVPPATEIVWRNVGATSHVIDSVQFHDVTDDWQFRTQTLQTGDNSVYRFDSDDLSNIGIA